jgi:hypothetical protein
MILIIVLFLIVCYLYQENAVKDGIIHDMNKTIYEQNETIENYRLHPCDTTQIIVDSVSSAIDNEYGSGNDLAGLPEKAINLAKQKITKWVF